MNIDDIVMTNLSQPGGSVKILDITVCEHTHRTMAYIEHVEAHPYGYEKGCKGWYCLDELRPLTEDESAE